MLKITFVLAQIGAIVATAAMAVPAATVSIVEYVQLPYTTLVQSPVDEPDIVTEINSQDLACMAEAMYWEGRDQSNVAMAAIGYVIMTRVESEKFPDTVCDVVHQGPLDGSKITRHRCQFSYFCDGNSDVFPINNLPGEVAAALAARTVAPAVLTGTAPDHTQGATHYIANYASAFWQDIFVEVATVETHIFYIGF